LAPRHAARLSPEGVAYGSVGEPWWPDNRCDPGTHCNASTGTCVTPTAVGAECSTYDGPCATWASCLYPPRWGEAPRSNAAGCRYAAPLGAPSSNG